MMIGCCENLIHSRDQDNSKHLIDIEQFFFIFFKKLISNNLNFKLHNYIEN